jgi:beta-lactamase regulating signal transducer with metallopeptidase domain
MKGFAMSELALMGGRAYLVANVAIAGSFILYLAARAWLRRAEGHRSSIRFAQILFSVSLLAPVLIYFLPAPLPTTALFHLQRPLPEGGNNRSVRLLHRESKVERQLSLREPPRLESAGDTFPLVSLGILLFFTGLLFKTGQLIWSLKQLSGILRASVAVRRLGRVTVSLSDHIAIPFSYLSPRTSWVVLPQELLESRRDFQIALAHEIQHHRQRDTAWAVFMEGFIVLFYVNPFSYLWKKEMNELQEFSCDETLVGRAGISSRDYGSCLVRVAEAALGARERLVGTTSLTAGSKNPTYFKSFLRRRVEMILKKSSAKTSWRSFALGTVLSLVILALAYGVQPSHAESTSPTPGTASFDDAIQKIAESELQKALKVHEATSGFVLVAEPTSGRVLALANIETDPKSKAPTHWALRDVVEPASVMKAIVTAVALDKGATELNKKHNCENGKWDYGGEEIQDWKKFSSLTTAETVLVSSNICGIKVALELGIGGLEEMIKSFKFGPGGITSFYPEAVPGKLPTVSEVGKEKFITMVGTGYSGIQLNPIEVLAAYGAIANGGKLMKPLSAHAPDSDIEVLGTVLKDSTAKDMRQILADVINKRPGTAAESASKKYLLAGKTSTAYSPKFPGHNTLGGATNVAGFVGFAPADHPRVAIYVNVNDPKNKSEGGPHGSAQAAPLFRDVAEKILAYWNVPTTEEKTTTQ